MAQSVEVGTTSIKVPVVERSIPGWKLVGGPEHWLGTALVPPLTHSLFDNTECPRFTGHVGQLVLWSVFFLLFVYFSKCKSFLFIPEVVPVHFILSFSKLSTAHYVHEIIPAIGKIDRVEKTTTTIFTNPEISIQNTSTHDTT